MSTLVQEGKRKCDSRCYNAKRPKCHCLCGGINHGVGFNAAVENVRNYVKKVVAAGGRPSRTGMAVRQGELFPKE